jgi:hypothetical protein
MCAKCRRPVEHAESWKREDLDAIVFEVRCHGEVDRCELPEYYLMHPDWQIVDATAFKHKDRVQ